MALKKPVPRASFDLRREAQRLLPKAARQLLDQLDLSAEAQILLPKAWEKLTKPLPAVQPMAKDLYQAAAGRVWPRFRQWRK